MQHLSRSARLEQRSDARREAADALPALSHRHAASRPRFTTANAARRGQQPAHRTRVRELPRADSRLEQSGRATRSCGEGMNMRIDISVHHGPRGALSLQAVPPRRRIRRRIRRSPHRPRPPADAGGRSPDVTSTSAWGGQIDVGLRGTIYSGRLGRGAVPALSRPAQRRRRRRFPLRARKRTTWSFHAQGDHVGYRDQRYFADLNTSGKMNLTFEFNQIPLFFSQDTRTPLPMPEEVC